MSEHTLVTVLIPAYNAASTIRRAIDSAIRQDYRPIEIVVVNDASQDQTAQILHSYRTDDVRIYSFEKNRGVCHAMNFGISQAKGEYIAFLDADDEWLEGKLRKQVALISENSRMTFVTCGCEFVSEYTRRSYEFGRDLALVAGSEIWRRLLAAACVAKPCVLARTVALKEAGLFDISLPVAEDQDMWIKLALAGEVGIVDEILVRAHDTPDSLTKKYATRMADYVLPMVQRHIEKLGARLDSHEIDAIWGERYSTVGRNLYAQGIVFRGALYLWKAIARGQHVRENFWYLMTASPPARALKSRLFRQ